MSKSYEAFRTELYGSGYDIRSFKVYKMAGPDLPTAGLTIPCLKAIASKHFSDGELDPEEFSLTESLELTMCYFWLSLKRIKTFRDQMDFLAKKLRYAKSWIITDSLAQFMRKGEEVEFLPYFGLFVKSKYLYKKRFAYVYAIKYYREGDISLFLSGMIPDEEYYVYMGQAWLLATLAIRHFEEVKDFLSCSPMPEALKRKAISKIVDSFQITDSQKQIVKEIRAKLR
jgi:3-methyladenine DNA glycosylase AlkD